MMEIHEKITIIATLAFSVSLVFTVLVIPLIHRIGLSYDIVDKPNKRKIHKKEIVRIGGIGISFGFITTLLLIILFSNKLSFLDLNLSIIFSIIFGSLSFFLIGFLDDISNLSPYLRLFLEILITSVLFANGLKVEAIDLSWINNNFEPIILNNYLSYILVVLWIVGLTNATNWLDGLDGLASGITTISTIGLAIILISLEKWDLVFICAAFCGSIIGFLRYNIYPAKILMGDCGSYLLGSTLGIISIFGLSYDFQYNNIDIGTSSLIIKVFPIHIAILLFFVPIADMTYVIFSRILKGNSPFYPDKSHLHHTLLDNGFTPRSTVIIIYTISQIFVSVAFFMFTIKSKILYLCISFTLFLLSFLYIMNMKNYLESDKTL